MPEPRSVADTPALGPARIRLPELARNWPIEHFEPQPESRERPHDREWTPAPWDAD